MNHQWATLCLWMEMIFLFEDLTIQFSSFVTIQDWDHSHLAQNMDNLLYKLEGYSGHNRRAIYPGLGIFLQI